MKIVIALMIAAFLMVGGTTYAGNRYSTPDREKHNAFLKEKPDFQIYANDNIGRDFVVIGLVQANSEKGLRKVGLYHGADAIVNYHILSATQQYSAAVYTGTVFVPPIPYTVTVMEGIAVRWPKEGEQGITKITPNITIPLIGWK